MLSRRIALVVPSTIQGNKPAGPKLVNKWVKATKTEMARLFGGFTATPGQGGWFSPKHGLIEENVVVVESFTDDSALNQNLETVREFAIRLSLAFTQEAISLKIDNTLEFVTANPPQTKAV